MSVKKYSIALTLFFYLLLSINNYSYAIKYNSLYTQDSRGYLYTLNSNNGVSSIVGAIGISSVTDLAFKNSQLFGVTFRQLIKIDVNTGVGRLIGSHGFFDMNALVVSSNGTIYSAGISGDFIKINPTTGVGQLIGNYGNGIKSSGDLVFATDGVLYATVIRPGYANDWLVTVNLSTGVATPVGDIGYNAVFGLSFIGQTLYGSTASGQFLEINKDSGAGRLIGNNSLVHYGMTTSPVKSSVKVAIEKNINGESSIAGNEDPLVNLLAGRLYRADYTVTNTSTARIYDVNVFDDDQGANQLACNLYSLDPGESANCYRFYQIRSGTNAVPARVEAKISGVGTMISASTPQVSYVGQDTLSGGLTLKHALNNKPGDTESSAVMLAANSDQLWQFKVTNTSNIDVYKVKVYNDGVFPLNTGWEELCLIGKLKIGETRYCNRSSAAGQSGLNLMMGRAQANDAYAVGRHQYINAANPTYYIIEP